MKEFRLPLCWNFQIWSCNISCIVKKQNCRNNEQQQKQQNVFIHFYTCGFLSLIFKITIHVNTLTYHCFGVASKIYALYMYNFYLHLTVYLVIYISHSHATPPYCTNITYCDGNILVFVICLIILCQYVTNVLFRNLTYIYTSCLCNFITLV